MYTEGRNRINKKAYILVVALLMWYSSSGINAQLNQHVQQSSTLVANGDYLLIGEGREDEINVLNNDFGLQSGIKELIITEEPLHAKVNVTDDFKIYIKADIGFIGEDKLVYKVCNNNGQCDVAKVMINIEDVDFTPKAINDTVKVSRGNEVTLAVLSNDLDLYDAPTLVYILSDFNNGVGQLDTDNNIVASFNEHYRGVDSLQYEVCDANDDCTQAWAFVQVESLIIDGIFIPQGISPNGDGYNDTFIIPDLQGMVMRINIFDVLGNIVYRNNEYSNGWDGLGNQGKFAGKLCEVGTYFFRLQVPSVQKEFSGFIYINM